MMHIALGPGESIGAEVHQLDQSLASSKARGGHLDDVLTKIRAGFAVLVPAGAMHDIVNSGQVPLELYTLYAPPNHRDGVVHHRRADAEKDDEALDGKTTE